ncbi:hypothetical protein EUGRSUZ_K03515 [Eucalyptus grandis]|uniref:Uncharacterized protein n=2 Tax=Eucalyptus grandis TaxID=71139 RepID=A0ACC3IZR4_EUCGR|nr:hypothetical protein EUGRSUZ_K03515 [Eucalyptus grandis]
MAKGRAPATGSPCSTPGLPWSGGANAVLFRSGGILYTCIRNVDLDLSGSVNADRIVPFRQQNGTDPRLVSFAREGGRSMIVGRLSQFNADEKSRSW